MRREIPYLQATMYYFVYYINILLTRKSRLNSRFKKRTHYHSFMGLNRASNVPAADWLFQTHVKNYRNFSRVVIGFFSVVEIPIKHSILYNKSNYLQSWTYAGESDQLKDNITVICIH